MNLPLRDYRTLIKTLIKRSQHSYKFPINSYESLIDLLSRDYRTPIKTPIKRLQDSYQDSYQENTALLSRDYRTLIKRS